MLEPIEYNCDEYNIHNEENLKTSWNTEQVPLMPVGRIDLVRDQQRRIDQVEYGRPAPFVHRKAIGNLL